MQIWRNSEVRTQMVLESAVGIALSAGCFFIAPGAGGLCLLLSMLLIGNHFLFLRKRYRDLEELSGYLRQIVGGDYTLDLRDNAEGELSILKNEIYKVTMMLAEQGSLYREDQKRLAEAIADITHQLKTPLTSMTMLADLLGGDRLKTEDREAFISRIQQQISRMDWLLSALLKLSKIDAGTAVFHREEVHVSQLLEQALAPLLIPIELKQQSLKVEGGDGDITFLGDINWTAEALINILKNCIEHTPEGGTITISYSENPLYTEIKIRDTGEGIDKEDLPYIFKRFYRGKNAGRDSVGIGLAMAKTIAAKQMGDLSAKSAPGEGTEFTLRFYRQVV